MRIARPARLLYDAALALILGGAGAVIGSRLVEGGAWLGLLPVVVLGWRTLRGPWRRWRLSRQPFPDDWHAWLSERVPFYRALDGDARDRFERDVRFYLDEQTFEAVADVTLTDDLRLSVAAGAAMLLHGRPDWELPRGRTVLFYPGHFDDEYYIDSQDAEWDGIVHEQGPIILSAPSVEDSWIYPHDGHNLVLHELVHLFDFSNVGPDGMPSLMASGSEEAWRALVRQEMQRVEEGRSLLRDYAASSPSELFAVAVENFFERPEALYRRHWKLYEALQAFFNLDPRQLIGADERAA